MNTLVFDIETVPDTDFGRRLYGLKGLNDAQVGKIMITKRRQDAGSEFLPPEQHRVVAISVVMRSRESLKVWSLGEESSSEKDVIERFFDGLERYTPDSVSWNGAGFDLPVLHYRSLLHGVTAARYWETGDGDASFRYSNYLSRFHWRHMDLMDILSGFQGRGRAGLHAIACLLGLPGKLGMDGAQVWDTFLAGGLKPIRDYCETDVLNTYLIYLRFELLRGRLSALEHAVEVARVRQLLKDSTAAHFQEFLAAWPEGLKPVEPLDADVVALSHDGRGIARVAGKAVFIAGALPGERVRIRVIKRRRQFDEAALLEIVTPSPDRVTPRCAHFGVCGGCSLQHLSPAAQLAAKQGQLLDNLERIGGVQPLRVLEPLQGPAFAYRRRARLGVRYVHKKGRVLAGFRERDKPYLADVRRCEILIEPFASLPEELAALVGSLSVRERVPQVEVAAGDDRAALVFRIMEPLSVDDVRALEAFAARLGVQVYLQPGGLDTIRPLSGDAAPLAYVIDGGRVTIEFGPSDFVQINRDVNVAMVDRAIELLAPVAGDSVLDLFCGLGNFTLPLSRRASAVVGVEGDETLVHKARCNALRNGLGNAQFFAENLFAPATFGPWAERTYDLVLLDPPRAGAIEIMERMAQWRPRRVVYISCHPGSLARDAGLLVRGQGYRLIGAGVMDMFPHTTHVESLAVLERGA